MEGDYRRWYKIACWELENIYCSSDIIRIIKSRLVRWTGCAPLIGEIIYANKIFVGIPERENVEPRKT
jgi:hypothetical protein